MTETVVGAAEDAPRIAALHALQSDRLRKISWLRHGITRRIADLGPSEGNVGYGPPRDPNIAWEMRKLWAREIRFDPRSIVGLRQVHGAEVIEVRSMDRGRGALPGSEPIGSADALVTRDVGITLMTLHADCLPLLIVDPRNRAIAAVHAGWRGTAEDVAGATIRALETVFGSRASDLLAWFGPSIGPCCYEVGSEVLVQWREQAGGNADSAIFAKSESQFLDLRRANSVLLCRSGMSSANIEMSDICTKCDGEECFSHRGQGTNTGRFAAFIAMSDESE